LHTQKNKKDVTIVTDTIQEISNNQQDMTFEVPTTINITKITMFQYAMACNWVGKYQQFGRTIFHGATFQKTINLINKITDSVNIYINLTLH
jgi:hypothetical protein